MDKMEYKYLVSTDMVGLIRDEMKPYVYFDQYAKNMPDKQYTVRSVYYDTRNFDCYDEKIEGLREKRKFRIRGYNTPQHDSMVYLEIKKKNGDFTEKARAPFKWHQVLALFSPGAPGPRSVFIDNDGEEGKNAQRFLFNYYRKRLLPTVLIVYEREAFCGRFNRSLRITFDKNVRSSLYPALDMLYMAGNFKFAMPRHFILELKFYRGLPQWAHSIITRYKLQKLSISKYTICIDSQPAIRKFTQCLAHIPAW